VSALVGSFGARKTTEQFVPENEWTKVVCDEELWDVGGCYNPNRGAVVAGFDWRFTFVAGVALRPEREIGGGEIRLTVYQNGGPRAWLDNGARLEALGASARVEVPPALVRGQVLTRSGRNEREPDWTNNWPAAGEIQAAKGDVFELYVWHDMPSGATLWPFSGKSDEEGGAPASVHFAGVYQR